MIPKRLVKQMARHPDPLSEIIKEGESLAKQNRIRNTEKDLNDLRESVRRLVDAYNAASTVHSYPPRLSQAMTAFLAENKELS